MTKNQPAFDRMMEEARLNDELNDERYAEELYLNSRKAALPKEEPTLKPADRHNTTNNGTRII